MSVVAKVAQSQLERQCKAAVEADRCLICLDTPHSPARLPCGHEFCAHCISQLRARRVSELCPLCRASLPYCAEKLNDLGERTWIKLSKLYGRLVRRIIVTKGDGPNQGCTAHLWRQLSAEHQEEMDGAVLMMHEAADQGLARPCAFLGCVYQNGQGGWVISTSW